MSRCAVRGQVGEGGGGVVDPEMPADGGGRDVQAVLLDPLVEGGRAKKLDQQTEIGDRHLARAVREIVTGQARDAHAAKRPKAAVAPDFFDGVMDHGGRDFANDADHGRKRVRTWIAAVYQRPRRAQSARLARWLRGRLAGVPQGGVGVAQALIIGVCRGVDH
jgi:hypothetical protein